ncbi:MAG: sulfate adenylyltransferase [Deltaproteobacteria bacterium]|nr:sulfate adenylyltransferase [Deltaproteobacteria bacterium]
MNDILLSVNLRQYLELEKIAIGAFAPLSGFMNEDEFMSVVKRMRLPDSRPFPLPVVLDLTREQAREAHGARVLTLVFEGIEVGTMVIESIFTCDKKAVAEEVFGTSETQHPGVAHFFKMGDWFIGGGVRLTQRVISEFSKYELTPDETRACFAERGWRTVVGFQTRNVPHKAHEYLLRLALEQADGLFIQPLVGRKKRGDYTPVAIMRGYQTLIDHFLPPQRILLGVLSTAMRYAGPREAIFHAIIRRNYGCTHFIVGRDHAGVDQYYGKYDAHELTRQFDGELGIQIMRCFGPFYCALCSGISTERTCPHIESKPEVTRQINGTDMRAMLLNGGICNPEFMRPEVLDSLRGLPVFIEGDEE